MKILKLCAFLEKQKTTWFFIIVSVVFFILRFPSFFEPYWYGDEGIYEVIGFALNKGRHLYTGIWDNKPPLLYIVYGIFNGIQPLVRIASFAVGLLSVFVFYFVAKKLFEKNDHKNIISYTTTSFFAFVFATPLLEGNIANAENFMALPILIAALLVLRFKENEHTQKSIRTLFLPGFLLGTAFLFKVVAVFDFAAFFVFLFIINYKSIKKIKEQLPALVIFTVGFFIPLFLTLAYFFISGAGLTFIQSAFLSNVGYVGYGNSLIIPQGLLILKLIVLAVFTFFIFLKRKNVLESHLFIYLWLAFSIFNALFSQRPYTHYALVLLSSVSLSIGIIFMQKKYRAIIGSAIILTLVFVISYFSLLPRISKDLLGYYGNYASFVLGGESAENYIGFFDKSSVRDYTLSHFLKTILGPNDNIFIWGNNGQLYRLVGKIPPGRFIVQYHIVSSQKTLTETSADLVRIRPRYIVLMPGYENFPFSLIGYKPRFNVDGVTIYEKVI